jgi:hypothetical protein
MYLAVVAVYLVLAIALLIWRLRRRGSGSERSIYVALAALALVHGFLYSVLNPPWFAPDEPNHYEYARLLADLGRVPATADISPAVQGEILASMYAHDFWRLKGMETPAKAPSAFGAGLAGDWAGLPPTFVVNDRFLWYFPQIGNEPPLYYLWTLPALGPWAQDVLQQHYGMRWLTLLLYTACVLLIYWIGVQLFGPGPDALGMAALALFQPMFSYMGAAVNNDLAAALLGALWFAVAASLFLREGSWRRAAVLAALTALALAVKKTAFFLFPLLAVLAIVAAGRVVGTRSAVHAKRLRWALAIASLAVMMPLVAAVFLPDPAQVQYWVARPQPQTVMRSAGYAHAGSAAFYLDGDADAAIVQRLGPERLARLRGQQVVLEAMVSSPEGETRGLLELVNDRERSGEPFVAGPAWQPVRVTMQVPQDAQYLRVLLHRGEGSPEVDAANAPVALYFDEVKLTLDAAGSEETPGENFLYNGSAEEAASRWRALILGGAQRLGVQGYVTPWFMQPARTSSWALLGEGGKFAFRSFWGLFGSVNVAMPAWWDAIWRMVVILAMVGLLIQGLRYAVGGAGNARAGARRGRVAYMGLLAAGVLLLLAQIMAPLLNRPDPNWYPQGRFLFPVMAPIAILLYSGWLGLLPRAARPWLFPLVYIGALIMDAVALLTLVQFSYCV